MEAVANVTIRVACPGEIQPLASQVKAMGIAAQYVTVVTRTAVSGAVGRVAAVRSLVLGVSLVQGMLMLSVKACDDEGYDDSVADDARGIVLGNLVLWAIGCAVSALAVAAHYALGGKSRSIRHAVNQLGGPSQLLPLAIATVPSTASATVYLLNSSSTTCASNIALAIVGIFMCFFPLATLCGVAYAVPRHLKLRMTTRHGHQHQQRHRRSAIELMKLFAALLFHRQFRWTPSEQGNNSSADALVHEVMGNEHELSSLFLDRRLQVSGNDAATVVVVDGNTSLSWHRTATVILLEYITSWYATLDLTVLVAACFLGAVGAAISSSTACRASAVIILLLYAGQLIVCAVVRPFTTLFAHVYSLFTLLFTVIAMLCQVVFLYAVLDGGSNNTNVEMLRQLLMTTAVCDLVVTGVSILRALLDGIDVIRAIYRHAQVLVAAVRRSSAPPPRAFVAPTTYVANEANEEFFADEIPIVDNNNVNHNNANADVPLSDSLQLLSELDDVFWTSDGKAAVLLASLHSNKDSDKTPEEEGIRSSHYHEWDRD
ncbi:transmembrane protein, putative [Bodo saltans]|uniref:Transmembrane protein, putative n=1 Tax=Bodo saltans TaxID=75058 RepID=A0A0S4JAJ0_BODSA|nr:transmembrane protein, putative [Bodo saltans]|eukprot:CUG88577.1 transmembrane protein, putative [Bodo saltans]